MSSPPILELPTHPGGPGLWTTATAPCEMFCNW
jgi:hypothetical protein